MSAFIVDDKTINSVVEFTSYARDAGHIRSMIARELGVTLPSDAVTLADAMFGLNVNAVEQRYGIGEAVSFRPLDFKYARPMDTTRAVAVENLGCWLYQCAEGNIPDTSKLYSAMEKVKRLIEAMPKTRTATPIKPPTRDIDVNETSKIIKRTLKVAFPNVKFSVRLSKYAGGHSIDAHWTDGPTDRQVKAIMDRFNGKGFDGMTDCSFYCGERMYQGERVDFHSGYVNGSRRYSAEFMRLVAARVAKECNVPAPEVNAASGYLMGGHNDRVPYQFHDHWIKYREGEPQQLTMCDMLSSRFLLASDSHEGEYLSTLIMRVAGSVSLKPVALAVELPEYIDVQEKASTGRASFEEPMRKFEGHEALESEARAIAEFEGTIQ